MNYKRIISGLFILCSVIVLTGFIDPGNTSIQKIAIQLSKWTANNQPEKVYLHLDKPYYAVGDDIWFKAYVTIGARHQLTDLSGILNVELIDDKDSVKQFIKLPMVSGLAWGDFALNDTLQEGNYRVWAYTNYMRNAGEDYFFDEPLIIVNATTNKVFTKTNYTYTSLNGQQKVNALINYTDVNGTPYTNKEVRYAVEINSKTIVKEKRITDNKGDLNITFTDPQKGTLISGRIITALKPDNAKNPVTKVISIKATSANVDVQFFPESGDLVNGINSKVAFKAVGADGLGADITGNITDDENKTITTFKSTHLGMGVFNIEPLAGRSYKAHITYADGSENTVDLPKAIDKGYVLSIDNTDSTTIGLKISTSQSMLVDNPNDTLSLLAQSGGEVVYAAKSQPGIKNFAAVIPKSRFPSGIIQFTLFSSKGEPLNERLVFVQGTDQLKLNVSSEKQTYAPQEKVKINLNAQNSDSKAVEGSFSVAVTDETKVPVDESAESTILSNLLLTSDLRGYIEKPNYYFTKINANTLADLDVLMLTQGYHRFEWKKILNNDIPPLNYLPERALKVSGHITTLNGKPIIKGKVTLMSTSGGLFILDTLSDEHGHFTFNNLAFTDSVKFVVQARTDKDRKNINIDLDSITRQVVTQNKNAPAMQVNINDGLSAYMKSSKSLYDEQLKFGLGNHTIVLKEVVIKEKKQPLKNSSNLNGAGNADQVITADQMPTGCPTLEQCLEGRLVGVIFQNGKPYSTRNLQKAMLVVVDGASMPGDFLTSLNMNDVAAVEVLRSVNYLSIYGPEGSAGVILITTKRGGDETYSRPAPGVITYSPKGLYKAREFYSPQYDESATNKEVADLRSTIYWNPNLITDKNGNTSFDYYNAGGKGTYRVVIEGIDNDGNIGRQVYRYKVE